MDNNVKVTKGTSINTLPNNYGYVLHDTEITTFVVPKGLPSPLTCYSMFKGCSALTHIDFSNLNTSAVTNMANMFNSCTSLTSIDLSNLNTINVKNIAQFFAQCTNITKLDFSMLNLENVTNMSLLCYSCQSLTEINLSTNTPLNKSCSWMFAGCKSLKKIDLTNFNTSNVTDMDQMFVGCSNLTELDLTSFTFNTNVNVGYMLANMGTCTVYVKSEADKTLLENNASPSSGVTIVVKS